jgi:hypothetical protein
MGSNSDKIAVGPCLTAVLSTVTVPYLGMVPMGFKILQSRTRGDFRLSQPLGAGSSRLRCLICQHAQPQRQDARQLCPAHAHGSTFSHAICGAPIAALSTLANN